MHRFLTSQNVLKTGLKIPRGKTRAGSIPASGTIKNRTKFIYCAVFF